MKDDTLDFDPMETEAFQRMIDALGKEEEKDEDVTVSVDDSNLMEISDDETVFSDANDSETVENSEEIPQVDLSDVLEEEGSDTPDSMEAEKLLEEINASLAEQINLEMEEEQEKREETKKGLPKWWLVLIPLAGMVFLFMKKVRKGMPKWLIVLRTVVFVLIAACLFFVGTLPGRKVVYYFVGKYLSGRTQYDGNSGRNNPDLPSDGSQGTNVSDNHSTQQQDDPNAVLPPDVTPTNAPRIEEHIVNILLLGEEAIDAGGGRGRTDLIIVATLDTKQDKVKLTSLMRDMLVAVPRSSNDKNKLPSDARLNEVFSLGGVELLYKAVELNFEITLDGYMLVGFDSFEQIVDNLDGVDIELTAAEAKYLNTTNYISKPEFRNVETGVNHMNGNQALGFCRIRKVKTVDNVYADFGRTSRQRMVLNAIFEKVKSFNILQLLSLMNECLPLVKTDITSDEMSKYMEMVVENRITTFVEMRIPVDGSYTDVTYNGQGDLIGINFPENIKAYHEFIFGNYSK